VYKELVIDTRVAGWNDKGLTINNEAHVADKSFIKDRVNSFAIKVATLR